MSEQEIGIGTRIYKPIDTTEKRHFYADCAGWCNQNGATLVEYEEYFQIEEIKRPPLPELEAYKEQRNSELETMHRAAEDEAHILSSLGFEIDANRRANEDIAGLLVTTEEGATVSFMDYSNVPHEVTREDLKTIQKEIILAVQSLYAQKWSYRNQIDAMQSSDALSMLRFDFFYESFFNEAKTE